MRIDHVAELTMDALARVIDAVGPLATYSRTAFSSHGVDFTEGTNRLDGTATSVFAAADPVDDAGQTRTRNQRAIIRALVNTLDLRKIAKDHSHLVQVLTPLVDGIQKDPGLTSNSLVQLAADLRAIARTSIVTVTVPAASVRQPDGTVRITFEADVVDALRDALNAGQSGEVAAKLADMGY